MFPLRIFGFFSDVGGLVGQGPKCLPPGVGKRWPTPGGQRFLRAAVPFNGEKTFTDPPWEGHSGVDGPCKGWMAHLGDLKIALRGRGGDMNARGGGGGGWRNGRSCRAP